jgi:pyridoxamine 5'-phosphate oxidase
MVLLKGVEKGAFVFFGNYHSRKAGELAANPWAALDFFWDTLDHQVRVEGKVKKVSAAESDRYFASRPRGSQVGAWASPQSGVIPGRDFLEKRVKEFEARFEGRPVPRPPHWGGYRLEPDRIEFWVGRQNRLHDRILYRRQGGRWVRSILAP